MVQYVHSARWRAESRQLSADDNLLTCFKEAQNAQNPPIPVHQYIIEVAISRQSDLLVHEHHNFDVAKKGSINLSNCG